MTTLLFSAQNAFLLLFLDRNKNIWGDIASVPLIATPMVAIYGLLCRIINTLESFAKDASRG